MNKAERLMRQPLFLCVFPFEQKKLVTIKDNDQFSLERMTRLEPATSTLARLRSTN
jgi:hypothetical protein